MRKIEALKYTPYKGIHMFTSLVRNVDIGAGAVSGQEGFDAVLCT